MVGAGLFLAFLAVVAPATVETEPARVDFPDIEMSDRAGEVHRLSTFRGAVTVLNFWATWCGPCRYELPELQKLFNEFGGKGVVVLAVNVDGRGGQVDRFVANTGLTLPVMFIDGRTQATLGIDRLPFTVILDREGKAVRAYPGFSAAAMRDLRELTSQLLREGAAKGGK